MNIPQTNSIGKNKENKFNESVNSYEDTLLHYAVFHKKMQLIDFLLKHEADPFKKNKVYFYSNSFIFLEKSNTL